MKETSTDRHIVQTNLKNLKLLAPIVLKHMSYSELAVSEKFIWLKRSLTPPYMQ